MPQIRQANPLKEIELLIEALSPNETSYARRHEISGFIERVLRQGDKLGDGFHLFGSGSFTSRTYLPASDIDLVLVTKDEKDGNSMEMENIMSVFGALCTEVALRDSGSSVLSSVQNPMTIRNVEFINARTKLCHCLVNNVGIDVTINSTGALTTVLFIEECDRYLGRNHIFKKSLMLIKAWALNESPSYVGQSLLGSKTGMLSSYALCVLVLCLFNQSSHLTHPLSVLLAFYDTYATVDWGNVVVTINGIIPVTPTLRATGNISMLTSSSTGEKAVSPLTPLLHTFSSAVESLRSSSSDSSQEASSFNETPGKRGSGVVKMGSRGFSLRSCNIQDPVDKNNNLGYSVTRHNLELLSKAFMAGRDHIEHILRVHYVNSGPQATLKDFIQRVSDEARMSDEAPLQPLLQDLPFVRHVFPSSYREYILSLGTRCDLLDHPMQTWQSGNETAPPPGAPEASFVERLHASMRARSLDARQTQQLNQNQSAHDLLNGELQDMWHALKIALSRDTEGQGKGVGRGTPVQSTHRNGEVLPTILDVGHGTEPVLKTPVRLSSEQSDTSMAQHSPHVVSLTVDSPPKHSNSLIDSDNETSSVVNMNASRATSPSEDSAATEDGNSSGLASGGSSSPSSPISASSPEQGPSGMFSKDSSQAEPIVHSAPEWSVEPELYVPTAPSSSQVSGGNKKTRKKKRKGSSSSLSSPAPVASVTTSPGVSNSATDTNNLAECTTSFSETKPSDNIDQNMGKPSTAGWPIIKWTTALKLGAVAAVVIAVAITVGVITSGPLFHKNTTTTRVDESGTTGGNRRNVGQTTTTILAPSLSGAEALTSLDVSLSAVSQISSVSLTGSDAGSDSSESKEVGTNRDSAIEFGSLNRLRSDVKAIPSDERGTNQAQSTIWVTKGQVVTLGPSSVHCPLAGLGPSLVNAVAENGLENEVKITDESGGDPLGCPVVAPPPRFEWRLNGETISDLPEKAQSTPFYTIHGGASHESQGEYTCVILLGGVTSSKSALALGDDLSNIAVSGRKGTLGSSTTEEEIMPAEMVLFRMRVQLATEPEITKSKSAFFDLAEGQPLYLVVNAEANPPPSFQWYLNGVALPGETRKTLNIGSIKKEHAGAYTCEVSNIAGQVTFMDITVSVRSSPLAEPTTKPGAAPGNSGTSTTGQKLKPPTRKKSTTTKKKGH